MKRTASFLFFALAGVALLLPSACSSSLSQPFEGKKQEPITIFRLQNYEPPPPPQGAPAPTGLPQLPPQIQQWLSGAAAALPPGLIPPGLLPGGTPAPSPAANVPRYYNFRILGSMSVTDADMRKDILDLFGNESNFTTPKQSCMYAEFGFSIGAAPNAQPGVQGAPGPAGVPADVLVSLSCNQVQLTTYAWPYGSKTGLTADTAKKIVTIVQKAFGG